MRNRKRTKLRDIPHSKPKLIKKIGENESFVRRLHNLNQLCTVRFKFMIVYHSIKDNRHHLHIKSFHLQKMKKMTIFVF